MERPPYSSSRTAKRRGALRTRVTITLGALIAAVALRLSVAPNGLRRQLHTRGQLHPFVHVALFAVLGFLAMFASPRRRTRVLLFVAVLALGLTMETAEAIRFGNPIEVQDLLTDLMGTILGAVIFGVFDRS